jgi:3-oxoacyl-[acyl-carrier-protein] synthase-1
MPEKFVASHPIKLRSGGVSNDANHISGPSRTGEELALAIAMALDSGNLSVNDIDFVSAHGTATAYNDEMEAKAFSIAGLESVPLHSLKGYYGHTLGAAGVIESIICMHALRSNLAIRNTGYETIGVSRPLNICTTTESMPMKRMLKTASGFGGCNAALILEK